MKRIFIISIITCLLIPFFAINTFASTYDLGTPSLWYSPYPNTSENPYPAFLPQNAGSSKYFLLYYEKYNSVAGWQDHFLWSVKSNTSLDLKSIYESISYRARDSELDYNSPAIAFGISADSSRTLNNTLCIPGLEYEGVYWPSDNQVIKIEFYIDTYVLGTSNGIPESFYSYLQPRDLCFFTCTAGDDGTENMSLLSKAVHFDSVVVSPSFDSRKIKFTYYFNGYGDAFNDLKRYVDEYYTGATLSLVVRFPYYLGSSSLISDGAYIVSNANLPVSYELMTPGDYSQELGNIKNAITESNEKLMDYYDTLSGEDQAVIVHAKQQNDKLDSTIDDYDNAQSGIDDIVQNVTLPPVNIEDVDSTYETIVIGNLSDNDIIWGPFIATLCLFTFIFANLSLLLFGKKG